MGVVVGLLQRHQEPVVGVLVGLLQRHLDTRRLLVSFAT